MGLAQFYQNALFAHLILRATFRCEIPDEGASTPPNDLRLGEWRVFALPQEGGRCFTVVT